MKRDSRLSSILHLLLHLAHSERALTSEELAGYLHSNAAVVRRELGRLRKLGYVSSNKGHGGGWAVSCDLAKVTLRDVYDAVGAPDVFAMGNRTARPECLVELAVNEALDSAFEQAQSLLIAKLSTISLAELSADFNRRFEAHPKRSRIHGH
ncbi:Rrf2 family transcriptional regulator [Hydrocarboniphaga effusa]|jgi:DNA-binding IscR family transcriptional regulator|uniref:Rrf2 family transcriptional regulator n=1 Tax=Hydrocarboniphaga effusa TaxID=243629 RepID=UPI0031376DA9